MQGEQSSISNKLDEEFEGRFTDNPTDPRAKMVHLFHTPLDLTAVVCTVGFEIHTDVAPSRAAIVVAHENISLPELDTILLPNIQGKSPC